MTDSGHTEDTTRLVNLLLTVKSINLRGNKLLLMVSSVNSVNLRGKSLLLTVKSIKVLGGKLLLMVNSVNSINLRGDKLLLVVKSINLGLVDLVVEGIGEGSLLVVSKSGLKNKEKIKSGFSPVLVRFQSGPAGYIRQIWVSGPDTQYSTVRTLSPVEPYLQSMVLDLGSLDTVGILRGNGTIGISYKS